MKAYLRWGDGPSSWSTTCMLPRCARTAARLDPERGFEDIGIRGSGGVARNLFDSPAVRELRDVLGGDGVQVGAIYPYNEADAKKAKDITHRMDSAWAQTVDLTPTPSSSGSGWRSLL